MLLPDRWESSSMLYPLAALGPQVLLQLRARMLKQ